MSSAKRKNRRPFSISECGLGHLRDHPIVLITSVRGTNAEIKRADVLPRSHRSGLAHFNGSAHDVLHTADSWRLRHRPDRSDSLDHKMFERVKSGPEAAVGSCTI